jgi:hypothetical protein
MVDLETTGTSPDRTGILQIAAVPFNLEMREIGHDMFCQSMWLPPHRFWSEDTRGWWLSQNQEVFAKVTENAWAPDVVMRDFATWVTNTVGILDAEFWAKPTSFDFPFVSSYLKDLGIANPFKYWLARDVNTFIFAKTNKAPKETWDQIEFVGEKHNALCDCIHQIRGLFHAASC